MEEEIDIMNWYDDQIEERRKADRQILEESFAKIAGVVLGAHSAQRIGDDRMIINNVIDEILKIYHCKSVEIPDEIKGFEMRLDYALRPHGLMRRNVELKEGWYKDAFGPMLAFTRKEGLPVVLVPGKVTGYYFTDPETGKRKKVGRKTASVFDSEAICFYRPLPMKKLGIPDLLVYMKRCITLSDIILIVTASLAMTLVGMIIPKLTRALTGPVLTSGSGTALIGIAVCIICVSLSSQLISTVKGLFQMRLSTKTSLGVQAAMMMRLMSLPVSFFRQYSPGELKSRSSSVSQLCSTFMSIMLNTGLTALTSLLYIMQIFEFAPVLVIPSIIIVLITVVISVATTLVQMNISKKEMELEAEESGLSYALITGVQKIKTAGAEKRVFAKWLNRYADLAELKYDPPMFLKINTVINLAISLFSTILLYYLAVKNEIDQSSYYAFTAAYGMLMGAFMSVANIAETAALIRPMLKMAEPFLKSEPETAGKKEVVTGLSGSLELDHISFRYSENTPYIIDDLSLKIKKGEYVAIVGRTGCGKSTLVRLLLGFEKPEKGAIYYDKRDLESLDLSSLRKNIGTVMQDAGMFQGDIYSNIVITAPELTIEDAWEAAEKAGIADDIRSMPMQMNTLISEGHGGISGGQRQRILIARAIAPKPKILIFDEATSALDNKTQKQVSQALDAMKCTRIVIAHRLSTIRHCDRILVLEKGRIIEDGTYEELIERKGYFAELVERQRLDTGTKK